MQTYIVTEKTSAKALPLPFTVPDGTFPDSEDIRNAFAVRGITVAGRHEWDCVGPYDVIQEPVTVIVNHTNGIIDEVLSSVPARVILVDDNVDGADIELIMDINGVERYVVDFESVVDPDRVDDYVKQVEAP